MITAALIFSIYFFWFTPTGYRMSVAIHGFTKLSRQVYIDKDWEGDTGQLLSLVDEANERVTQFFGRMESTPRLIICDSSRKIKRLGGDHDTRTIIFNGVKSYTSISSEYLNVDILAHEITHGETHKRIYQGKAAVSSAIPIWFDEGLAIQNDYREQYSYETWLKITENGKKIPQISEYDTAEKFFAGTTGDRRARYCLAGREVSQWLSKNGPEGLLNLLDKINQGESFEALYFK